MKRFQNVFHLGIKELRGLRHDTVMLLLVIYAFSFGVYGPAKGTGSELTNASIAIVDEDRSQLAERIGSAFFPPAFQPPRQISVYEIDPQMDSGRSSFVLDIPQNFERDVMRGRRPSLQVNIDATAMQQAGIGAGYIQNIVSNEITEFVRKGAAQPLSAARLAVRVKFNQNLVSSWFSSVMQIINNVTMLAVILAGGALVRERERGTIDHLLTMPLHPTEIMTSKVWANSFVIVIATALSLWFVVRTLLHVPIAGSIPLFLLGTAYVSRNSAWHCGALDAATWVAFYDGRAANESPLRRQHARRQYAARVADARANLSLNALRQFRAGDSLPWRRVRNRLAQLRNRRGNRRRLFWRGSFSLPPNRGSDLNPGPSFSFFASHGRCFD